MSNKDKAVHRLGRGLESMFGKSFVAGGRSIVEIPVNQIRANTYQPRRHFDDAAIESLAHSIKTNGLAQPIVVRPAEQDGIYELIAGERRLRASKMAGFAAIPAIIKQVSDQDSLQLALVENLDREDLNVIEEALGYQRLIDEFQYTHKTLAELFGKSRSAVTNVLRLIQLPKSIKSAMQEGVLTEGHGRALLVLSSDKDQNRFFKLAVDKGLSVRDLESLIAEFQNQTAKEKPEQSTIDELIISDQQPIFDRIVSSFKAKNVSVACSGSREKGRVTFAYRSEAELQRLIQFLGVS